MAVNGALSDYQEKKFLSEFVQATTDNTVNYMIQLYSVEPDEAGTLTGVVPGLLLPVRFSLDETDPANVVLVNQDQLEFGVVGTNDLYLPMTFGTNSSTLTGKELSANLPLGSITVFGYYLFAAKETAVGSGIKTRDDTKPIFRGSLAQAQTVNIGIDLIIKKNQIKFTMN